MSDMAEHMADLFRLFGPITLRRMFSGKGVFRDGIMFGLIIDDVLYLKADDGNVADFLAQGLPQFTYTRQGKTIGLSYFQAPDHVMEDIHEAALWARRACDAALRSGVSKPRKKKPT